MPAALGRWRRVSLALQAVHSRVGAMRFAIGALTAGLVALCGLPTYAAPQVVYDASAADRTLPDSRGALLESFKESTSKANANVLFYDSGFSLDEEQVSFAHIRSLYVYKEGKFCYVATRERFPENMYDTSTWDKTLYFISWPDKYCQAAKTFSLALFLLKAQWEEQAQRPLLDPSSDPVFLQDVARAEADPANHDEDIRSVQVQAEALIQANRFEEAGGMYRAAVRRFPTWATGHDNLALIACEQKQYREAITEMKGYVYLAPNAPDARAAQDQIYRWEALSRPVPDVPASP